MQLCTVRIVGVSVEHVTTPSTATPSRPALGSPPGTAAPEPVCATSDTATPSRREANKARTRAALVAAVYDLVETDGVDALTAERVADAAGISRRTFFNYFSSVDALIAAGADEVLDRVRATLDAQPDGAPLPDAMEAVLRGIFTVELLAEATRSWRIVERIPAARRYALEAHAERVNDFAFDWVRRRLDTDADPLPRMVCTAVLLTAFDQGRRLWLAGHTGDVDERALEEFLDTVGRAIDVVRPAFGPH